MTDAANPDYEGKTNDELSGLLADRGLPHSGTKPEMIARLQKADYPPEMPAESPDKVIDGNDGIEHVHSATTDDEGVPLEPFSEPVSRPDAAAVEATTNPDGSPNNLVPNPLPPDAATGDIVAQVRRGEVDGHTIMDADTVADTQPGDILVSVDPFVTIAKAEAVQELRDHAGEQFKPALG